jgi:TPP-dependent pyruvate/acetoin dehydrogenase alpha subunit
MDPDEMEQAEADEPVARSRAWLVGELGVGADLLAGIDREVLDAVEAAFAAALAGDDPPADELLTDVFSSPDALPR